MKRIGIAPVLMAAVVVLGSCTKDPVSKLNSEDTRIYITNRDSTANFSSFKNFSISDSVAIISNNHLEKKSHEDYDQQLIAAFASAMKARGYTQVARDAKPDLGINVNNIINTYTGYVDYGSYYDGYYGYMDPYYWGYPGYGYYGSYIGTYQVNEGVISIDVFDLKDAANSGKIESIWNGVVGGEGIFRTSTVGASVQALFDQSPYLKTN